MQYSIAIPSPLASWAFFSSHSIKRPELASKENASRTTYLTERSVTKTQKKFLSMGLKEKSCFQKKKLKSPDFFIEVEKPAAILGSHSLSFRKIGIRVTEAFPLLFCSTSGQVRRLSCHVIFLDLSPKPLPNKIFSKNAKQGIVFHSMRMEMWTSKLVPCI